MSKTDNSKQYLCIICRKPDIVWLDFLKTFTQYKVYIVIDDNSIDYKDKYKAYDTINIIQVSNEDCKKNGYIRLTYRFNNEVTAWDKALYYFSKLDTSYDTIWFIEDDVFFHEEQTLVNIDTKYPNYDLLSNIFIKKEEDIASGNKWHWSVIKPLISPPYYRSMSSAVRLSRDLITKIKEYVDTYNTLLFHEIMFPTLCIQNKLIHNSPKEMKNIIYRNNYSINDIDSINMYHPVKDLAQHITFRLKN